MGTSEPIAPASEPLCYCRKCGYALRGLSEARCPECGRGFDPGNPRTTRRRPPRRGMRWVWRAGFALLTLVLLLAGAWGWLYWDWRLEQQALAEFEWEDVTTGPLLPHWLDGEDNANAIWLSKHLGSLGFVLVRATKLRIADRTLLVTPPTPDFSLLSNFHRLRSVVIEDYSVNDLSPFANLTELECLIIRGDNITDLTKLAGLTHLRELRLIYMPKVKNCSALATMTDLRELHLDYMSVRDLSPLAGLTNLKMLSLRGTKATDLTPLAGLSKLRFELDLGRTPVSDLTPLYSLKALRCLCVDKDFPADKTDALQRALPLLNIDRQ